MDAERKAELLEAVNTLIEAADASDLYKKLVGVYEVANKGLPVRLVGPAAALNPILELMLEDYPTAERVIELVDAKRAEADLPELDPGFDRAAYMRELMAKKRQRQTRLADLINRMRVNKMLDRLVGKDRLELMQQHANRWHAVRLEREDDERQRLGRRLTEVERQLIIARLWGDVDKELNDYEAYVNNWQLGMYESKNDGFEPTVIPKEKR
jgi:hypothetical protein